MKYWVHWLFVLATLTCALRFTSAGDVDVEDDGVCEWDDDVDMVSILPFEDDGACEGDDIIDMVSILPFEDDSVCEGDDDTDMVSILPVEDDGVCEGDDDIDMVSILPVEDVSETFYSTDTLGSLMMEVGKAVKETSSAQVSETNSRATPAAATSGDSSSTLSNGLGIIDPVASISVSVSVSTVFVTPTSLPEVSVQTITVENPPVTVFATLTSTLTLVASDVLPSGMVRITDIDSLTTRVITVSSAALDTLRMGSTPSPPPTAPKQESE